MGKSITFKEIVDTRYLAAPEFRGITDVYQAIRQQSEVCTQSLRAAYSGSAVTGRTVRRLIDWARIVHRVELDAGQLVRAPTKPRAGTASRGPMRRSKWMRLRIASEGGPARVVDVTVLASDNDVTDEDVSNAAAAAAGGLEV